MGAFSLIVVINLLNRWNEIVNVMNLANRINSCLTAVLNGNFNLTPVRTLLFFTDHRMKRDHKRRQIVAKHAEEKRVLRSIVVAEGILPEQFRKEFDDKLSALPVFSERMKVMNRCRLTGRRMGPEKTCPYPWYFSRIMWREIADQGKMSGYTRATWGNTMSGRKSKVDYNNNNFNPYITAKKRRKQRKAQKNV